MFPVRLRTAIVAAIMTVALFQLSDNAGGDEPAHVGERTCKAANAADFLGCLSRANHGDVDRVAVTDMILCTAASPCGFVVSNVQRPLQIAGDRPGAGFSRAPDDRGKFELRIANTSGPIEISNLRFDMGRSAARGKPGEIWTDPACPSVDSCPSEALAIVNSSNVLIDRVEIDDAKLFGIGIVGSSEVTIRRSTFLRSGRHGIWVARAPVSQGLHIENSRFMDIRSNAVMLSGIVPPAGDPLGANTVTGNLFDHNHNAAVYHSCGATGHEPCAGGQIAIEHGSEAFVIADNEIRHGILDEDPSLREDFHVNGVEVAPDDIRSLKIIHNYFHDLSAGAIAIDSPRVAPQVSVIDNIFERLSARDPAIGEADLVAEQQGNCEAAQTLCPWSRPTGHLEGAACADGSCVTLRWSSHAAHGPLRILENQHSVVASPNSAEGEQTIGATSETPARYDLYFRSTLLDTIDAASPIK
jgi:hypothetical protein